MNKVYSVANDGPSGAGKSSVARAAAQKLGWIRKPEEIKKEFAPEMADGAEKYFNRFNTRLIDVAKASTLMLTA